MQQRCGGALLLALAFGEENVPALLPPLEAGRPDKS